MIARGASGSRRKAPTPSLLVVVALALSACSFVTARLEEPLAPTDYKRLVALRIPTFFTKNAAVGDVAISGLRRDNRYFAGDWSTCLRVDVNGRAQLFSVFFRENEIVQMGTAVLIDKCEQENFEPFSAVLETKEPEINKPEISKPDANKPGANRPETKKSEAVAPNR